MFMNEIQKNSDLEDIDLCLWQWPSLIVTPFYITNTHMLMTSNTLHFKKNSIFFFYFFLGWITHSYQISLSRQQIVRFYLSSKFLMERLPFTSTTTRHQSQKWWQHIMTTKSHCKMSQQIVTTNQNKISSITDIFINFPHGKWCKCISNAVYLALMKILDFVVTFL